MRGFYEKLRFCCHDNDVLFDEAELMDYTTTYLTIVDKDTSNDCSITSEEAK